MNQPRFQHLTDAFNSIIAMMLAEIRVRGLRSLLDLPQMILTALFLRRLGREFAAMIANLDLTGLDLSALPPSPAPAPQAEPAPPEPAARARSRAAAPARAPRARPSFSSQPESTPPTAAARRTRAPRDPAFARPRHAPHPRAIFAPLPRLRDPSLRDPSLRDIDRTS